MTGPSLITTHCKQGREGMGWGLDAGNVQQLLMPPAAFTFYKVWPLCLFFSLIIKKYYFIKH